MPRVEGRILSSSLIRGLVHRASSSIALMIGSATDPFIYGPRVSRELRVIIKTSGLVGLSLIIASAILMATGNPWLPALAAGVALPVASLYLPRAWRALLGHLIDMEVPALQAYILPYSSTGHIADLLARLRREESFRWVRFESERLEVLLDSGMDPQRALKYLLDTTPSRVLRETLADYLHAYTIGVPRTHLSLMVLESVLERVKLQWRWFSDFGRGVTEIVIAGIVGSASVTPLFLLAAPGYSILVVGLASLLAVAASATLVLARPVLGDYRPPIALSLAPLVAASAASLMAYAGYTAASIALLALAGASVEAYSRVVESRRRRALHSLRRAAENAKYGVDFEEELSRAEAAAEGVVRAIISASRIAGRSGVWEAIEQLYRVVWEAYHLSLSSRSQALIMVLVSMGAGLVALYSITVIGWAVSQASEWLGVDYGVIDALKTVVVAASILAPLPASTLYRPWMPSLLPSLASLLLSLALG